MARERRADRALPARPLSGHDVGVQHGEEIDSDELDGLLNEAATLSAVRAVGGTEVRLYVAVDPETLQELEQRAAADGTDLNAAAAEALRVGAHTA